MGVNRNYQKEDVTNSLNFDLSDFVQCLNRSSRLHRNFKLAFSE